MAFDDYLAVMDSDVYEYRGSTKAILARIAHLIIGPPPEKDDGTPLYPPSPDEGYCVATQGYLACQLGISDSTVHNAVLQFENDDWLIVSRYSDKYGHKRNKYAWAAGALEKLKERKRQRDEHGEYVRDKQVNKQRNITTGKFAKGVDKGRVNLEQSYPQPEDNLYPPGTVPGSHQATCLTASRHGASKLPGTVPAVAGVAVGVGSTFEKRVKNMFSADAVKPKAKPTATPTPTPPEFKFPSPVPPAPKDSPGSAAPPLKKWEMPKPRPHHVGPWIKGGSYPGLDGQMKDIYSCANCGADKEFGQNQPCIPQSEGVSE
jgi:hypothetical protein